MKYNNRKTFLNGITFDSAKEANRYRELSLMLSAGLISDLKRQVKYILIPSQKLGGKVAERPVTYIADFVYTENGEVIVEDTKGVKTKDYIIKRKLMLYIYGIRIKEV